jgi:hypothetical protein
MKQIRYHLQAGGIRQVIARGWALIGGMASGRRRRA